MINLNDTNIPLPERIAEKKKRMQEYLNPFDTFNPNDFEPLATADEKELCYRKRVSPPKQLPTFGLKPKEIMSGQMIGMYESKQDIYLILAHRCNEMQNEIDALTKKIKTLENKNKLK